MRGGEESRKQLQNQIGELRQQLEGRLELQPGSKQERLALDIKALESNDEIYHLK